MFFCSLTRLELLFQSGTYCQQREVEAITEDIDKNRGLCCCEAGRFPHMLSLNAAFTQRWLAWEVLCLKFVVDGYSIKENKFNETVVGYDLRKRLISLMIKVGRSLSLFLHVPMSDHYSGGDLLRGSLV